MAGVIIPAVSPCSISAEYGEEPRGQRNYYRSGADHDYANCNRCSLPGDGICNEPAGNLCEHPRNSAHHQDDANRSWRPSQVSEIECNECSKAGLHIRDEEIRPVKAKAALEG